MIQNGELAQAAAREARLEEAVDHRQAVREHVGQHHADQIPGPGALGWQAVFDQMGADGRVLDHGDIVVPSHVAHAAARVARQQIAAQQVELLHGGLGLDLGADQIGVALKHTLLRAGGRKAADRHPHRDTGVAALAGGAIGDVLAAAETGLGQFVIHPGAVAERQVGEYLALDPPRQIGAGRHGRQVEAQLPGGHMAGHARPPAGCGRCRS